MKQTPLHQAHVGAGARMVPFAGWDMPVQYTGILDEVRAVRNGVGLFDVSHMGRLFIEGTGAVEFLDRVLSTNVPKLRLGRARYCIVCDEAGGIIDDCIVYRLGENRYMLVPNASNTAVVTDWLGRWAPAVSESITSDVTDRLAMVAIQGPHAISLLQPLVETELTEIRHRAHRIHRRGRRRILRSRRISDDDLGRVGRKWRGTLRTRRQGCAPPRGGPAAPRQRHGHVY